MTDNKTSKFNVLFTDPKFYAGVTLILFATWFNLYVSNLIQLWFPNRLPSPDLLFNILPYIGWTQYITDIAVILCVVIVVYYIVKHDFKHFPFYLAVFGFAYLFRAIIIPLTPLGSAFGNMATYGLTTIHQYGMFPSGHTALAAVSYIVIDRAKNKQTKMILFMLLVAEVVSLLLSRGHYSIDIVGGLLISYFVFMELSKFKSFFALRKV